MILHAQSVFTGVEVMQERDVALNHSSIKADDKLQSALVLGTGCSKLDGDGGSEDQLMMMAAKNCNIIVFKGRIPHCLLGSRTGT